MTKFEKNDVIQVAIIDISSSGEGVGKVQGFPFFIKDAIIGDEIRAKIIKIKKSHGYARLQEIIKPSEYRVEPLCPLARPCGGCQLQEMSYARQLRFKEEKLKNNLLRIGGFSAELLEEIMEPIIGMDEPFHYRNKAQFPFGQDKDGTIITGFYAGRTHTIIPATECPLGVAVNKPILETILSYMKAYKISPYDENTGQGLIRHVLIRYGFQTGEIMVCLVVNLEARKKNNSLRGLDTLLENLKKIAGMTSISLNFNTQKTNVIMGEQCLTLWGQDYITDYLKGIQFRISPLSFYQVNPVQTEKLYQLALDYADIKGNERVWDLYCGIGSISLFLSQKAKEVIGVEVVPEAIADAKENARINSISNVKFYVGKAEELMPELVGSVSVSYAQNHAKNQTQLEEAKRDLNSDIVVVDPPRKGCDLSLLETIINMNAEKIVYVSCDSATLARDLKYLCEHGYELKRVRGVDQFPQTVHIEVAILLSKP